MFKKIVWATDGSDAADKALLYVEGLAKQDSASVEVVHVVEYLVGGHLVEPLQVDEPELQQKFEQQVEQLKSAGIDAELKVVPGLQRVAAHAIAETAQEDGADLIVVGTRGHSALGSLVIGSVTQRLLHISNCPVFAVPVHD
jgi:nucleotide-binding universal stress UspA family protein